MGTGSLTDPELTIRLGWQVSKPQGMLLPPALGLQVCATMANIFYMGAGNRTQVFMLTK